MTIDYWQWWSLAALLIVAELMVPGTFLVWFGAAAVVTGLIALVWPGLDWAAQVVLFAALSGVAVLAGLRWYRRAAREASDHPALNRRGQGYVGQCFVLDHAVQGGRGRMTVGDTSWMVSGPDLPAGTRVRVVSVDGICLRIVPDDGAPPMSSS